VQQFRAGFKTEFAAATMSAAACSMQFVLPNRTPLPATREAGLVQIAISLTRRSLFVAIRPPGLPTVSLGYTPNHGQA